VVSSLTREYVHLATCHRPSLCQMIYTYVHFDVFVFLIFLISFRILYTEFLCTHQACQSLDSKTRHLLSVVKWLCLLSLSLYHQIHPEDGDSMDLWNGGIVQHYMASKPRGLWLEISPLWKPQNLHPYISALKIITIIIYDTTCIFLIM